MCLLRQTRMVLLGMVLLVCFWGAVSAAHGGFKFDLGDQLQGEISIWAQTWYQFVENGKDSNGDGIRDTDLHDFLVRRAYLLIRGEATPYLDFFTYLAADRIGQDVMVENSSLGLGGGVAFRDLWITLKLHEALKLQAGRMYVPLTRNYGTTSTMSLLTTDLDWGQGGIRSNIFYPSKVGRDDGVTLWGNIRGGLVQYRVMVGDGEQGARNPDDNLRFAGRISASLWEPETGWFNPGTYLGTKRVLSLGAGLDTQQDLLLGARRADYQAWTLDVFYDQPLGGFGAVTVEGAYIDIRNGPNPITFTQHAAGDDASILSLKAGYLFPAKVGPGQFQPFMHWQRISVDEPGKDDTDVYGLGLNYFIKGHANKVSLDFTFVDQKVEIPIQDVQDHFIVTLQLAAGF